MQEDWNWLLLNYEDRATKDLRARIAAFVSWGNERSIALIDLDLAVYRDFLLKQRGLSPNTVRVHLATLRGRFKTVLDDGSLRAHLTSQGHTPEQIEVLLSQVIQALQPRKAPVKVPKKSPRNKGLTAQQISELLNDLELHSLLGLRDSAVIALMATMGLREKEVCGLDVDDLDQTLDGEPALRVREGLGSTARLVPYGEYEWVRALVKSWLNAAEITSGAVFRGFYKSGQLLRPNRLSSRAVERLVANHPIIIEGEAVVLKPLDLRHAYAYNRYERGIDMDTLSAYLGLKSASSVLDYVDWGRDRRGSGEAFYFDRGRLSGWSTDDNLKGGGG